MSTILNFSLKNKALTLNRIALYVLLFFAVFDTARLYTPLPAIVGYLKEICIFFLFIQVLLKKIEFNTKSLFGQGFVLLFFISLICLFRACFFSDYFTIELLIYQIKNLEFFLLFLIFINFHKIIPSMTIEDVLKIYIFLSVILVVVNLIGVLVPNPICYKFVGRGDGSMMFKGRMSLGQPAMASFPILLTFILFWMKKDHNVWNSVMIFISLISIILSTAMTAYAIVLGCVFLKLYSEMKNVKGIKHNILFVFLIIVLAFAGYRVVVYYLSLDASIFNIDFLKDRFLKMMGYGTYEDLARLARTRCREVIMERVYSESAFIWGLGPDYYYQIKTNFYAQIPIENTYVDFYAKCGLCGVGAFFLLVVGALSTFSRNILFNIHNNHFLLIMGVLIAMLLYSWTLPIFATFCMATGFALFFAYLYLEKDKNV